MKRERNQRRRYTPFTLIEIMIVIVIIGMIAALVGPNIMGNLDKAKQKSTKIQLVNLKNAVYDYYKDLSSYPNTLQDLITNPGNDKWNGPYLDAKSLPKDSWDSEFVYVCPGEDVPFDIMSYGADKTSGGTGKNADLSCWK